MTLPGPAPTTSEVDAVADLLGRRPQGEFRVVVRNASGEPVVLMNAPLLDDGTPMPTLYWLVGKREVAAVSTLEADATIDHVEALIGLDAIDLIHRRYENERDRFVPSGHHGPRPSGGVGGTRRGVKCLHAHYGHWLAGGDDAVGAWVHARLLERGLVTDGAR